jgi:ABC-type Fe3+ transport system substrate-binding protein
MSEDYPTPPPEQSLAAQAVIDATGAMGTSLELAARGIAAAALRAAADQVVPWQPEPTEDSVGPTIDYGYAWALFSKANDIRQELITIADELDGATTTSEND